MLEGVFDNLLRVLNFLSGRDKVIFKRLVHINIVWQISRILGKGPLEMIFWQNTLAQSLALVALGLLLVFFATFKAPSFWRLLEKVILNCVVGVVLITFINTISFWTGLTLPVNGITLVTSGVLGAPGVIALATLKILI